MVATLIVSAKLIALGLLEIKVRSKNYDAKFRMVNSMTQPTKFYYVTQIIL